MGLRARDRECHRIRDIYPTRGESGDHAAAENEQRLAVLVALAVTMSGNANGCARGFDAAEKPDEQVEHVRAEVAERADTRLRRIRHPTPFRIEPTLQRAGVAVRRAHARHASEHAG